MRGKGVIELQAKLIDGKKHVIRVLLTDFEGEALNLVKEAECLETYGKEFLNELSEKFGLNFEAKTGVSITKEFTEEPIRFPTGHKHSSSS